VERSRYFGSFGERGAMKTRILTIFVTAVLTSLAWYGWFSVSRSVERFKLLSAVQAPGRMALDDIQADLGKGRYNVAQAKVMALKRHWAIFEAEGLSGEALGRVMVTFSQVDPEVTKGANTEPDGAANRSQPVRRETNQTPAATGSAR